MSKRYFKIDTGRYGGELVVGSINSKFVDYWAEKVEEDGDSDLIDTLQGFEWDDDDMGDNDSPVPKEEFYAWHECDDLEHVNGPFEDNDFHVVEIKLHQDAEYVDGIIQWKEGADHDYRVQMFEEIGDEERQSYQSCIYSRECYTTKSFLEEEDNEEEYTPVLNFFSSEKGGFGDVYVETEGEDFDPKLLQTGQVETDMATIIESYWYDRKPLQINYDYADTTGKGYYAGVGYVKKQWHDTQDTYINYDFEETDALKEAFEWFYEDIE